MIIYSLINRAAAQAQTRANERGEMWAVYRGRMGDYIAAPAHPLPGFPFPGGSECWGIVERVAPNRWDRRLERMKR